jgi:hypothetical protein
LQLLALTAGGGDREHDAISGRKIDRERFLVNDESIGE